MLAIFFEILKMKSWSVPSGQILEQYTLPYKNVNNKIIIKPATDIVVISINLNRDGINWKYKMYPVKDSGTKL